MLYVCAWQAAVGRVGGEGAKTDDRTTEEEEEEEEGRRRGGQDGEDDDDVSNEGDWRSRWLWGEHGACMKLEKGQGGGGRGGEGRRGTQVFLRVGNKSETFLCASCLTVDVPAARRLL